MPIHRARIVRDSRSDRRLGACRVAAGIVRTWPGACGWRRPTEGITTTVMVDYNLISELDVNEEMIDAAVTEALGGADEEQISEAIAEP